MEKPEKEGLEMNVETLGKLLRFCGLAGAAFVLSCTLAFLVYTGTNDRYTATEAARDKREAKIERDRNAAAIAAFEAEMRKRDQDAQDTRVLLTQIAGDMRRFGEDMREVKTSLKDVQARIAKAESFIVGKPPK